LFRQLRSIQNSPQASWRAGLSAVALLCATVAVATAQAAPINDIGADFGWNPAPPTAGRAVTFTATALFPSGVKLKGYDWDLDGNGSFEKATGTTRTVTKTFPSAGTFLVRLRVRGSGEHQGIAEHAISVVAANPGNKPPLASYTFAPSAPVVNQPVTFTSTSSDPEGSISQQVWDLNGDGDYDNGGGPTALRTFAAPGAYVVGLSVTDDKGLTSFYSRTISVTGGVTESAPRPLSPFPVVRIAGRIRRTGTRIRLLTVEAPAGAKVSVRCHGRGCPFKKRVRALSESVRASARVRVRRLERFLPAGVTVRVFVTKRGAIGKYTRFRMRAAKAPSRADRCLMPSSWAPVRCPAA
jgi:hypothetical protein